MTGNAGGKDSVERNVERNVGRRDAAEKNAGGRTGGTQTKELWSRVSSMNLKEGFSLGPINSESLLKDPKHLAFTLSRYKFAAKMLLHAEHVVDVGCGEGLGAFMFLADTKAFFTGIDFDQDQIAYAKGKVLPLCQGRAAFFCQDLISVPYRGKPADGLVSLDVIEHIHPEEEKVFLSHLAGILPRGGIAVIGTPNRFAEVYASARSGEGHINLFEPDRLRSALRGEFSQVFLFSMNDELVHTGYGKMAHYLIALCVK